MNRANCAVAKRYKIETNVPIPEESTARRGKCFFPVDELQVGQSFCVPHSDYAAVTRNLTRRNHDASGRQFIARATDKGVRVWRTA